MKHFKMGNGMIRFIFYKSYFICSLEGSRNLMNGGGKKNLCEFLETRRAIRSQKVIVQAGVEVSFDQYGHSRSEKYSQDLFETRPNNIF